MKNFIIIILVALAGAFGFAAYQDSLEQTDSSTLVSSSNEEPAQKQEDYASIKNADVMMDSLVGNASKNHPDELTSVGMQKEAVNAMDQLMHNAHTPEEKLLTAAMAFFGAYYLNASARAEFCAAHNVDLSPFVQLFKEKNAAGYARTLQVMKVHDLTVEFVEEQVRPQFERATKIDMRDIATVVKGDLAAACRVINDKRDIMVQEMSFQKRAPDVYQVLMNGL